MLLSAETGMAPMTMKRKTRRGSRGGGKGPSPQTVVRQHHNALNAAMGQGDMVAAKTHAFNLGSALHAITGSSKPPQTMGADPDANDPNEATESTEPGGDDMAVGKNWIQGAISKPGELHKSLGVPAGDKIPKATIAKAATSTDPKLAARARLAQTLAKLRSKK